MIRLSLTAAPRTVFGKKVKTLRKLKLVPGTVYGRDIKSISVEMPLIALSKVYRQAGRTGLIDLEVGPNSFTCLIKKIQLHPVTDEILHVEFHKVNLKEKITATVPLEFIGEAEAVKNTLGILLPITTEVEVEALPTDLPEKIAVNVEKLAQLGDQIVIADLVISEGVKIMTEPETVVVKVAEAVVEEKEPVAPVEEATPAPEDTGEKKEETPEGAQQSEPPTEKS